MALEIGTIFGVNLGFEYIPKGSQEDEEMYGFLLDLFIFRFVFMFGV